MKIKFGTDGWRAIIAKDYTVENVARVAEATANWLLAKSNTPSMVLGYDCRFAGQLFAETTIKVIASKGVKVYFDKHFVSTPMISLAANKLSCEAGVIITASHNLPSYNGYKLKSGYGGPTVPAEISVVENQIKDSVEIPSKSLDELENEGMLVYQNFEDLYFEHVKANFDLNAIEQSGLHIAYDAMYGAGQNILPRVLPNATLLHCDYNPSFKGQAPEPIHKNLAEFSELIKTKGNVDLGLANDGDADRIGIYNKAGEFVDAHHIILLLIHILCKYKQMTGKVVIAFSVSPKIKALCEHYGLEYQVTKIGFKYIAEIMIQEDEDVLVGGEESGGIAVKGHIPERDGIWDGLVIIEHMAKSAKSLEALIEEVYEITGPFAYNRNDLHITNELKQSIIEKCQDGFYKSFGNYNIEQIETIDGFKYYLDNDSTVMIRPSGTEPVLRVYGEAPNHEAVNRLLKTVTDILLN